jgi:very-short-patch-repair endonuclease
MQTILFVLLALVIAISLAAIKRKTRSSGRLGASALVMKRNALTNREQVMYFRLTEALHEHIVLAQVAFSALLKTHNRPDRNRFDRKVADFVVMNRSFEVLAIIELDDSSHKGRERQDAERQALLTNAGYRVIRYNSIPDIEVLKAEFKIGQNQVTGTITASKTTI